VTEQAGPERVTVEKLTLHVPAMSETEARALAADVARALRRWPAAPVAGGQLAAISVEVTPEAGSHPTGLGDQIAAAVCAAALRELGG